MSEAHQAIPRRLLAVRDGQDVRSVYDRPDQFRDDVKACLDLLDASETRASHAERRLAKFRNARDAFITDVHQAVKGLDFSLMERDER